MLEIGSLHHGRFLRCSLPCVRGFHAVLLSLMVLLVVTPRLADCQVRHRTAYVQQPVRPVADTAAALIRPRGWRLIRVTNSKGLGVNFRSANLRFMRRLSGDLDYRLTVADLGREETGLGAPNQSSRYREWAFIRSGEDTPLFGGAMFYAYYTILRLNSRQLVLRRKADSIRYGDPGQQAAVEDSIGGVWTLVAN